MKKLFLVLLLSGSACFSQVTVTGVEYLGTGCPEGSVKVAMSSDGAVFSVLYNAFNVQVNRSLKTALSDCRVVLHVKKPKRLGLQIESAEFRGFVALDIGVTARQHVEVATGPNKGHQQLSAEYGIQSFTGPISENFTLQSVRPTKQRPGILDCVPPKENTDIIINSQVQLLNSGTGEFGQLTVDSADGVLIQRFSIKTINCSKN